MTVKPLEERVALLENELRGFPDRFGAVETRVTAVDERFQRFQLEVRNEFSATREQLRKEIREGDEETRRLMRVLHEDLVARIALVGRG